jgi:hypothetical protein
MLMLLVRTRKPGDGIDEARAEKLAFADEADEIINALGGQPEIPVKPQTPQNTYSSLSLLQHTAAEP